MPLRLVEATDGSFTMRDEPRYNVERGLRRDNNRLLRKLAEISHNAKQWIETLFKGPFYNDPDDDLRTQAAVRRDRAEAFQATSRATQLILALLAVFSPLLASE